MNTYSIADILLVIMTIELVKAEDCIREFKRNAVNNKSSKQQGIELIQSEECITSAKRRIDKMTPHELAVELKRRDIVPKEYKRYSCKFYNKRRFLCTEHARVLCDSCTDYKSKYSK